ncbi:MAG: hypothetical protein Q8R76_07805 [Candidatus Omnitrophota bacterium]|nr:hypothetical protein [Candidatus Omnitrophota bacterium]
MDVERWNAEKDGPFSERALQKKIEKLGYSVLRYAYPPGTFFPNHTHSVDKIDGVVAGLFRMTAKEGEVVLEPGDCLKVPRGTAKAY